MTNDDYFAQIEDKIKQRDGFETIKKAYYFSLEQHKGMKRLSGDDYITHPLEVVKILLDLNVDDTTIIAAMIHEVINNGESTTDEIRDLFGEDVAMIVNSISKINKLELPDNNESSVVYLRKILRYYFLTHKVCHMLVGLFSHHATSCHHILFHYLCTTNQHSKI